MHVRCVRVPLPRRPPGGARAGRARGHGAPREHRDGSSVRSLPSFVACGAERVEGSPIAGWVARVVGGAQI